VLALTNFQSGTFRLQSRRLASLYIASGLLEIGHAEPVVWFLKTTNKSVFRRLVSNRAGTSPFPSSEKVRRNKSERGFAS